MSKNVIFGKKAILDALNNNIKIEKVLCLKNINHNFLNGYDVKIEFVNNNYFDQYKNINHQNIVAFISNSIKHLSIDEIIKKYNDNKVTTILMIDENEDPRNFGSILRSAASFDVDVVIYKNAHQAQINDLVIKTSMGAAYQLDFCKVANLSQTIEKLKNHGYWVYASALNEKSNDLNEIEFDNKSVIIVGNENHGVSDLVIKKSDFIVKIPMSSKVQSLNISVASGILLYKRYIDLKSK